MKALVCEMCNSNDVVKQDGYFVCQNCGTKYSVEEARKIMLEGPVVIDETAKVDNYYNLAENALASSNNKAAEDYCNKILEIDPNHWKAWLLKGKAAGWQSTLANLRLAEAMNCFTNAVSNAPEECVDDIHADVLNEVEKLNIAIISLCCDNFSNYPSKDNANAIKENLLCSINFLSKFGKNINEYKKIITTKINNAAANTWNRFSKEYYKDRYPSDYQHDQFLDLTFLCIDITQMSIDLCDENDKANITRYENMIGYTQAIVDDCSWYYDAYLGGYHVSKKLTKEARRLNIDNIMRYHYKIREIDPNYVVPRRPK